MVTCLILEPVAADRMTLQLAAQYAGYVALTTHSELDALLQIQRACPAILIVSVDMSSDSLSLVRRLAGAAKFPLIAVSERADRFLRVAVLEAGADDFIMKPFFIDEFSARLQALLRRVVPQGSTEPPRTTETPENEKAFNDQRAYSLIQHSLQVYKIGLFEFDPLRNKVAVGGKVMLFTEAELIVLRSIVAKEGMLATKEEIEEMLYKSKRGVNSKVVDVVLSRIRKKLGETFDGGSDFIINHRGRGWSLNIAAVEQVLKREESEPD